MLWRVLALSGTRRRSVLCGVATLALGIAATDASKAQLAATHLAAASLQGQAEGGARLQRSCRTSRSSPVSQSWN
jgi:ApbE superfamily uncharacterized protein (UPF0280 family)